MIEVNFYQTETAQKVGEYKETKIDSNKKEVEFCLIQTSPYVIRWKNGNTEIVTKKQLVKLQSTKTWATDF